MQRSSEHHFLTRKVCSAIDMNGNPEVLLLAAPLAKGERKRSCGFSSGLELLLLWSSEEVR